MTTPWQPSTLTDWTTVLHHAAQVPQSSPRYGEAQQIVQDALVNIGQLNQTSNASDVLAAGQLAPGMLGSALAGVVGFGRGASLGLVKPPSVEGVGDVIGQAHPTATTIGDIAGGATTMAAASPLVAGLSPVMGGAMLAGGYGAARGAIDPALTGDRKLDALLGGLTGIVGGAVMGKIGSKLVPAVTTVGRNVLQLFASRVGGKVGGEEIVNATETALRQYLTAKGVPADRIEAAVARSRPLWQKMAPQPALAASSRAAPVAEPKLPMGTTSVEQIAPQGLEVRGVRATPAMSPQAPTLGDMTGMSNLQFSRAPTEVPAPASAPSSGGAITKSGRNVADILREGEWVMGRPLSAEEKDAVLQRLFGKRTSHPGHPYWLGPGAPTE